MIKIIKSLHCVFFAFLLIGIMVNFFKNPSKRIHTGLLPSYYNFIFSSQIEKFQGNR